MSPFFKPSPPRTAFFSFYKSTIYTLLTTIGLFLIITIPWFVEFVRDVIKEESRDGKASDALVYSTSAVMIVIIISILFFAAYVVSIESFRFAMAFGTVALFTPLLLVHQWRYVYALAIMTAQFLLGMMYVFYAVMIIKFETRERDLGHS